MKKLVIAAGLVAAISVGTFALYTSSPLAETDGPAVQARFEDGPTGFRFVWQRDAGWTFVGQAQEVTAQELASATLVGTASGDAPSQGEPLAVFVEDLTGYRFAWSQDAGWSFVSGSAATTRQF